MGFKLKSCQELSEQMRRKLLKDWFSKSDVDAAVTFVVVVVIDVIVVTIVVGVVIIVVMVVVVTVVSGVVILSCCHGVSL